MSTSAKSTIRLNKFIAHSGLCNRREADNLIKKGEVRVNGTVVNKLGVVIDPKKDKVEYRGRILRGSGFHYLILNKSKGFGKHGRSVSQLISGAVDLPLAQIGELAVNDLGLVLFTNDPLLQERIAASSDSRLFLYHIKLKKAIDEAVVMNLKERFSKDPKSLLFGEVVLVDGSKGLELGIMTNSAEVSLLTRSIQSVGIEVNRLERVIFAGLTKKDVPRGRWRFLTRKEVSFLKMV